MKLSRKSFLKNAASVGIGMVTMKNIRIGSLKENVQPPVCTLVPAEQFGPFPSLPSGDAMYWRNNIVDGQPGVPFEFTIRINGTANCGVMPGLRVDVWHCNYAGYYSHYATGGNNNGHGNANPPSTPPANNASLIYHRGIEITDSNGEVTFTSVFPGWYPGRTVHIHFAIYSGGTPGTPNGWVSQRVSQFTFPIAEKNALLTSQAPYSSWGADPTHPDDDFIFSNPPGAWATWQLGTLVGSGAGPYSSYFELAIDGTGVLPLDLIGFDASSYGQGSLLRWKTASEINFSHFEVEYSPDGEDFEFIAKVVNKGNNLNTTNDYIYEDTDRLLFGNAFYRLKIVDLDGTYEYSATVSVRLMNEPPIRIHPNPASDHIILYHPLTKGGEKIMIVDESGKAIGIGNLESDVYFTNINLDLLTSGMHYLIFASEYKNQTLKFVKQ